MESAPKRTPLVIGIVGQRGGGKDFLADRLIARHGAAKHGFSDPMREILKFLDVEMTTGKLQDLSTVTRRVFGEDIYSQTLRRRCLESPSPVVVVVGIRRPADVEALRQIPGFKLVSVEASPENRYARVRNRGGKAEETGMSWEEFQRSEAHEAESLIAAIAAQADIRLDNNGTLAEFEAAVDRVVGELLRTT